MDLLNEFKLQTEEHLDNPRKGDQFTENYFYFFTITKVIDLKFFKLIFATEYTKRSDPEDRFFFSVWHLKINFSHNWHGKPPYWVDYIGTDNGFTPGGNYKK